MFHLPVMKSFVPSLVILAPAVSCQVVLAFEPLCAFYTIELAQAGQVFGGFRFFVLRQMSGRSDVILDLVVVSARIH